jgi:putative tryptophan/tyrosine transport system substrate-binding protein
VRRREFIALVGAAATWPLGARAQHRKVWRVGFLAVPSRPVPLESSRFGAFARGMRELGYVEGENLTIEWRFADGRDELLSTLASELVQLKVDIIVAAATSAIRAAQKATTTIPIVMATNNDPVGSGFIQSLARPGGNITGLSNLSADLSPKFVEILLSIAPKLSRMAVLINPTNRSHAAIAESLKAAAQRVNLESLPVEAATAQEIESAFIKMKRENAQAIVVTADPIFLQQRERRQIAELAVQYRLPTVFPFREHVEAGGLISYGQHLADNYRRSAIYVDKIIKGAKPADLPVEQTAKFELAINLKTASALGLTIPPDLLILATEVIE